MCMHACIHCTQFHRYITEKFCVSAAALLHSLQHPQAYHGLHTCDSVLKHVTASSSMPRFWRWHHPLEYQGLHITTPVCLPMLACDSNLKHTKVCMWQYHQMYHKACMWQHPQTYLGLHMTAPWSTQSYACDSTLEYAKVCMWHHHQACQGLQTCDFSRYQCYLLPA